jgi:hypothetical protein
MQNSSPNQMMMLTTRIGTDTRLFITGDLAQTDREGINGLVDFMQRSSRPGSLVENGLVKIVNFGKDDVERSEIVNRVVEMYTRDYKPQRGVEVNAGTTDGTRSSTFPYSFSSFSDDFALMTNHTVIQDLGDSAEKKTEEVVPHDSLIPLSASSGEAPETYGVGEIEKPCMSEATTAEVLKKCGSKSKKPADNDCALIPKEHISDNMKRMGDWEYK